MSNVVFIVALLAATLAWLATVATTLTLHQSDIAGNGLSYSYATVGVIVTWALIAVLLVMGFLRIERPAWVPLLAVLAFLTSGAAAFTVINLLKDENTFTANWPIAALLVPPLLMLAFALWSTFPAVQRVAEPRVMFAGVWPAILLFSIMPFPLRSAQRTRLAARRDAYSRSITDRDAEERTQNQHELAALSDTSTLGEFLALVTRSTEMREAVLSRAKTLPNRQRDAVAMLKAHDETVMGELRNLALEATPELCESSLDFLQRHAVDHRGKRANYNDRFAVAEQDLEKYFFGVQWLAEHHCDVRPALKAYNETANLYPDSPERVKFLARIESIATLLASGKQ